ncbi:MAG: DUF4387 domain-containing protein [Clostridia bacterium]|nr:DUF4387 domain-containing protein [Clostridia bacterium]
MKLYELAKVIRSKNAGAFNLTLDIMFAEPEEYEAVKKTGVLSAETISRLYGVELKDVEFYECDNCYAFKSTIPLKIPSGGIGNLDTYGAQQHAPLMDLEIPI